MRKQFTKQCSIAIAIAALSFGGVAFAKGNTQSSDQSSSNASQEQSSSNAADQNPSTVREVQQKLSQEGFNPGPADGKMGQHTKDALQSFQKSKHIEANGQIDQRTLAALGVQQNGGSSSENTSSGGSASGGSGQK